MAGAPPGFPSPDTVFTSLHFRGHARGRRRAAISRTPSNATRSYSPSVTATTPPSPAKPSASAEQSRQSPSRPRASGRRTRQAGGAAAGCRARARRSWITNAVALATFARGRSRRASRRRARSACAASSSRLPARVAQAAAERELGLARVEHVRAPRARGERHLGERDLVDVLGRVHGRGQLARQVVLLNSASASLGPASPPLVPRRWRTRCFAAPSDIAPPFGARARSTCAARARRRRASAAARAASSRAVVPSASCERRGRPSARPRRQRRRRRPRRRRRRRRCRPAAERAAVSPPAFARAASRRRRRARVGAVAGPGRGRRQREPW